MMSESESLEEEDKTRNSTPQTPGESIAKSLELLSDEQTMKMVRVIAEDMKMRCDLYSLVRETQRNYSEIARRFPPRQDLCSFCHQKFGRSRKGQKCDKCDRHLCKSCLQQSKCQCCLALERLLYKRKEFEVLCPFEDEEFGKAKFKALVVERVHPSDWILFSQLELHFQYELKEELDRAKVNLKISDPNLENARQQLVVALMNFTQDSHFAFIQAALKDIGQTTHSQNTWILEDNTQMDRLNYHQLLTNAVIWIVVERQHKHGNDSARSRAQFDSLLEHKSFFPDLTPEEHDQVEELYSESDSEVQLVPNWFVRPSFGSPRGSMRSQSTSHIVNSITTPQFFRYGSEPNIHHTFAFVPDQQDEEIGTLTNVSLNGSLHSIATSQTTLNSSSLTLTPEPTEEHKMMINSMVMINSTAMNNVMLNSTAMNLRMDRQRVDAINGQFVRVGCQLMTNDPSVEILWYNQHRQLKDSSRLRIRNYSSESILEIFDCSAELDAGELICLAIGETGIVSDVCRLSIKVEDIAGEEPFFTETLHVSNQRPKEETAFFVECKCIGYPLPYVTFFHNSKRVEHGERQRISHNDGCWTLRITNACALKHNGIYTAVATNRCGRSQSRVEVQVQEIEEEKSDNAKIEDKSDKIEDKSGERKFVLIDEDSKTPLLAHDSFSSSKCPDHTKYLLKSVNLTMTEETIEVEARRLLLPPKKKLSFSNLSISDVRF